MGRRVIHGLLFGVCCLLCAAGPVWAGDPGLQSEIQALKERLSALETKLAAQEAVSSGAAPGHAIVQLPSGLHGVNMSGFVDTMAGYNFNSPASRTNTLRVFDTQSQSFMINNAELNIQKPVSLESPFGFKTSLMLGTDAEVVGAVTTGLGNNGAASDEIELKDAYAEYLVPVGAGLDIMAGKFATLNGAEVIESKDDWNISRSFLFGFAIPFTHTGIRATYPINSMVSATLGVNNGWDVVDDNNEAKTIETSVTVTPTSKTALTANYYLGAEQTGNNGHQRHLIDLVASYTPIDPLQLKLNYDYGFEQQGVVAAHDNASWTGIAGYARYALNDWWALAGRLEWFHDSDGVRTGFNSANGGVGLNGITGTDLNLWEVTFTNEVKINSHLIGRLEYRHDQANEHVFQRQDLGQTSPVGRRPYQDTVAIEFIAPF